ncbi:hypothetical protein ScalyP_jg171, partial [Parmales sp. scaly parma]
SLGESLAEADVGRHLLEPVLGTLANLAERLSGEEAGGPKWTRLRRGRDRVCRAAVGAATNPEAVQVVLETSRVVLLSLEVLTGCSGVGVGRGVVGGVVVVGGGGLHEGVNSLGGAMLDW